MRDLCRERFEQFGTAGHASKIKVIPLAEMAKRYRSGALDPRIGEIADAANDLMIFDPEPPHAT